MAAPLFQDIVIAEKLLSSKSKVSKEATVKELDKVWMSFQNNEKEEKEIQSQIDNCTKEKFCYAHIFCIFCIKKCVVYN